jgi:hypothetical protein
VILHSRPYFQALCLSRKLVHKLVFPAGQGQQAVIIRLDDGRLHDPAAYRRSSGSSDPPGILKRNRMDIIQPQPEKHDRFELCAIHHRRAYPPVHNRMEFCQRSSCG